jgi:hypothetical protein
MHRLLLSACLIAFTLPGAGSGLALAADPPATIDDSTPTVFYFHGDRRCATCRSIERTADAVVHEKFAKRLQAGVLAWMVVNYDEKKNRHYVKELSLAGSGVVVARVSSGGEITEPKILQDVWRLTRDEERMREYLASEIASYLGEE